jgi:hypothetical protein
MLVLGYALAFGVFALVAKTPQVQRWALSVMVGGLLGAASAYLVTVLLWPR